MPAAIPCIGYPSRSAACRALKAQGFSNCEIGEKTNLPPNTVAALIAPSNKPKFSVRVTFTEDQYRNLQEMAERENWTLAKEIKSRCFEI